MQISQERHGKRDHVSFRVSLLVGVREREASVFGRHGQRHHRAH